MKSAAWKELLADIDGRMVNLEVGDLIKNAGRDREKNEALGQTFYAMAKDGKSVSGRIMFSFWRGAMDVARDKKDATVFEAGLNALEAEFGSNPRARADLDKWKSELEGMTKTSQVETTGPQKVVLAVTGMT